MSRHLLCCSLVFPLLACHYKLGLGAPIKGTPLNSGATCAQSGDCDSGLCLTQHCCNLANCAADVGCEATGCDDTGACQYPTGSCGPPSCDAATSSLSQSSCVAGACTAGTAAPCPGSLACASEAACLTQCGTSNDCVGLNLCDAGTCVPALANGSACVTNGSCFSGICGVAGTGHCCTTACASSDTLGCAVTDCDTTGACIYPVATTSCVALSCTGHLLTEAASCDGAGHCGIPSPAAVDCSPYLCSSATQCGTTCTVDSDCVSLGFCEVANNTCCAGYAGGIIEVDGAEGVDQPCCGSAVGAAGCATIAYSVQLAGKSPVPGLTIHVANPPNGLDWVGDSFPIQLSYGVTLNAPGIYFKRPGDYDWGASVIHIAPFGGEATTSATVEGTAAAPIVIGIDSAGLPSSGGTTIQVDPPMTLNLLNAWIRNSPCCAEYGVRRSAGIEVSGGATLTLGADGLGGSGEVVLGSDQDREFGYTGILCAGTDPQHLAVVNDQGSSAARSVRIVNEEEGIDAEDNCSVDLSANPLFGPELKPDGTCPWWYAQDWSVWIDGKANVSLSAATFQCADYAIFARGTGTIALTDSVVWQIAFGIMIQNATLDLGGGGNTLVCNQEPTDPRYPGYSIVLSSAGAVNLEKTAWGHWDATVGHTQVWNCTLPDGGIFIGDSWEAAELTDCTCSGASTCPSGSQVLPNGADIVITDGTHTVDDENGSLAPNACGPKTP